MILAPSPLPPLRLSTPPLAARVDAEVTLSTVARLIASGAAQSKADLVPAAGMARPHLSSTNEAATSRRTVCRRADGGSGPWPSAIV